MSEDNAIPPVALKKLLLDLDFLAKIPANHKYCFTTRQYVPNTWYFGFYRRFLGEKQEINGNSSMDEICRDTVEQWKRYKNHSKFRNMILDEIVSARQGVQRCRDNYSTLQKTQLAKEIDILIIGPFDNIIPEQRKYDEGIISEITMKEQKSDISENFNE